MKNDENKTLKILVIKIRKFYKYKKVNKTYDHKLIWKYY